MESKMQGANLKSVIAKICFVIMIFSMMILPVFQTISYAIGTDENLPKEKYLSIAEIKRTNGYSMGYQVIINNKAEHVFRIEEHPSTVIDTPSYDAQPQLYCLYQGPGFPSFSKVYVYDKEYDMYTQKDELAESEDDTLTNISNRGNYNKMLNFLSYAFFPTESSEEVRKEIYDAANKEFPAEYKKLKDTDIEVVNQLVIWGLSNKDKEHRFYTDTGYVLYTINGTTWHNLTQYKSAEDENEGKDRQKAMESLYKYYMNWTNKSSLGGEVTNSICKVVISENDEVRKKVIEVKDYPSDESKTIYELPKDTAVTRTMKEVAYIDGKIWDEVSFKVINGTPESINDVKKVYDVNKTYEEGNQIPEDPEGTKIIKGYIPTDYLQEEFECEKATVVTKVDPWVAVRSDPTLIKGKRIATTIKDGIITVIKKNVATASGYNWDLIVANPGNELGFSANAFIKYIPNEYKEEDAIKREAPVNVSIEDADTINYEISGSNYIVGPITIEKANDLPYWLDFKVTSGDEEISNYKILNSDKKEVEAKDVSIGQYYVSIPITGLNKELSVSVNVNYDGTEASLWTNDEEGTQPVLEVKKETKVSENTFEVVPEIEAEILNNIIEKNGTESITSKDQVVEYTIKYNADIKNYVGKAVAKIVDKLPYEIDEQKSDLNGGKYDKNERTITWEDVIDNVNTFEEENDTYKLSVEKKVKVVFKDIDVKASSMTNKVSGYIYLPVLNKLEKTKDTFDTSIDVKGDVIVRYKDKNTGEEIQNPVSHSGKVGTDYDVTDDRKELDDYILVEEPNILQGTYTEEVQEKVFWYAKKTKVHVTYVDKSTGEEIEDDETIEGHVKKEYNTEKKTIEGYTYVGDTGNTSGEMTEKTIEVVYYYLYNTKVIVNHYDKVSGDLLGTTTKTGLVGDEYVSAPENFEGYVLVKEPENRTVHMTRETIVLNYYYAYVSAGVLEKHIDAVTNELLDSDVHEGNEGDSYDIPSKKFPGYDLVEDRLPDNSKGKMTRERIEVDYYYKKKARVRAQYFDKITGEKLTEDEVQDGHEGDLYDTEQKEFDNYKLVEVPKNKSGEMTATKKPDGSIDNEIVVQYYYVHESAGVIEKHIDADTEKVLFETSYDGYEGDDYSTEVKEFTGYDFVEERKPTNASGKMTRELIEVDYYYRKKAKLKVEYRDKVSGELLDEEEINGHNGDDYKTEQKEFNEYKFLEVEGEIEGKLDPEEDKVVTYWYAKEAKVIVQYLEDETEKVLADEDTIEGYEGDEYGTTAKDIKNYKLVKTAENATGVMKDTIYVKYYYRQATFDFGVDKIISRIVMDGNFKNVSDVNNGKVEIYRKDVNTSNVVIDFTITVTNEGEIEGKTTVVEKIPEFLEMIESENSGWTISGDAAKYETDVMKPGDTKILNVRMRWVNGDANFGLLTNVVTLENSKNEYELSDSNAENNSDDADIIITVSTGAETISAVVAILASYILAGTIAYAGLTFKKTEE